MIRNTIWTVICVFFIACQNKDGAVGIEELKSDDSTIVRQDTVLETNDFPSDAQEKEVDACAALKINDFKTFLGLEYGMQEHEILQKKILGDFSGGAYAEDEKVFVYKFNAIPTAPIELWIDTESGRVITVFLELLSKEDAYTADLDLVTESYPLEPCFEPLFGMTAESIQDLLGEPAEDAVSKDGVRLLAYDSDLNDLSISFKIYPDQNNTCTSIAVHWFYSED